MGVICLTVLDILLPVHGMGLANDGDGQKVQHGRGAPMTAVRFGVLAMARVALRSSSVVCHDRNVRVAFHSRLCNIGRTPGGRFRIRNIAQLR